MPPASDATLLEALLESWTRNHAIMLNLLRALPPGGLAARATPDGPTVAQQFMHLHHERLISVAEEAPEFARPVPADEWANDDDPERLAALLDDSAAVVRDAVRGRLDAGQPLDRHFGHPVLLLQLLLWHDGYHHGQIKLALKISGLALGDDVAGPLTWDVWRRRMAVPYTGNGRPNRGT
jgi:uncharacterized damage-inducible protein DinB